MPDPSALRTAMARYRFATTSVELAVVASMLKRSASLRRTITAILDGCTTEADFDEAARRIDMAFRPFLAETTTDALRARVRLARLADAHALGMAVVQLAPDKAAAMVARWQRARSADLADGINTVRGPGTLSGWLSSLASDARLAAETTVAAAFGGGSPVGSLIARDIMHNAVDRTLSRTAIGTRTAVYDTYRVVQLEAYRRNADVVAEWEWVTTVDDATCAACLSMDGQRFAIAVPFQPTHIGCRCYSLPIVAGADDPQRETGADWFARQDDDVRARIVPRAALAELREGRLRLADFAKLDRDNVYGPAVRRASLTEARRAAAMRRVAA